MNTALAELDYAVGTASSPSDVPGVHHRLNTVRPSTSDTLPVLDSDEYKLLYLPTMVAVYTARHQQMLASGESLYRHVFGCGGHLGCEACREETEFLVAHQKEFFE